MAILIIDSNAESMNKYRSMLSSIDEEIIFCTLPEQSFEYIEMKDINVIISELDLDIMTAEDIFSGLEIRHPEIVQMIMTEEVDTERILKLKNESNLFEILLKPFRFNEDMVEPLKRGIEENKKRIKDAEIIANANKSISNFRNEYNSLKELRNKRINDYYNVYLTFSGLLESNIKSLQDSYYYDDSASRRLKLFTLSLIKEFDSTYIFEGRPFDKQIQRLKELFNNELSSSEIIITNNIKEEISLLNGNNIYFTIFAMATLVKSLLSKYRIVVSIDSKDGIAITRFVCDLQYSTLNNTIIFSETDENIRDLMHNIVGEVIKEINIKTIKGYDNNPFISITMNKL